MKLKFNANGSVYKYKSRLISESYSYQKGIDYEESISHVPKLNTIILMIALVAKYNWRLHEIDVKFSFLNEDHLVSESDWKF